MANPLDHHIQHKHSKFKSKNSIYSKCFVFLILCRLAQLVSTQSGEEAPSIVSPPKSQVVLNNNVARFECRVSGRRNHKLNGSNEANT